MEWIDELRMETPEQIEVDLELAGLGSRFFAKFIDVVIKCVASFILLLVSLLVFAIVGVAQRVFSDEPPTWILAIMIAAIYLLWLGYGIIFESLWNGQTLGKYCSGIRVIQQGGAPIDFLAVCIRNLLGTADMLPFFYILGSIIILMNNRRQRLGDMAAGTVVIRERDLTLGMEVERAIRMYASERYAFTHNHLVNLSTTDRTILREFLRRSEDMEGFQHSRLARQLAKTYLKKTDYPLDEDFRKGTVARRFLASLLRDLEEYYKLK